MVSIATFIILAKHLTTIAIYQEKIEKKIKGIIDKLKTKDVKNVLLD